MTQGLFGRLSSKLARSRDSLATIFTSTIGGDDPDGDMPRDVHIFTDQSGNFIAVGVEQGIVSGAKNSRPFVSICEDAKWRLMKL